MAAEISASPGWRVSRRRRRHLTPLSLRRSAYDVAVIFMLGAPAFAGPVLYGGTGPATSLALMTVAFLGMAGWALRPFLSPELRRLQAPPGGLVALAAVAYGFAVAPFSHVPHESWVAALKLASCVGAYWAWTEMAAWHKRWRWLLGAILLVVTLIAWYAIVQAAHDGRRVLFVERPAVYGTRASGTYICPNHWAHLLELVLCASLALAAMPGGGPVLRLLAGYAFLVCAPVLFLTFSRSGWLGAAAGASATVLAIAWRRGRKAFFLALVALPIFGIGLGLGGWFLSPTVRERVAGAWLTSADPAVTARLTMWKDTLAMIRDAPWFGHGPGSYRWIYDHYSTQTTEHWYTHAHNEYLHGAAEFGLAGLGLLAAAQVAAVWGFLRRLGRVTRERDAYLIAGTVGALIASAVHAVFDFNLQILANVHVLVLFAGVAAAALYASGEMPARPLKPALAFATWGGAGLLSVACAVSAARVGVAYGLAERAERLEKRLALNEALAAYRRAAAWAPGYWGGFQGAARVLTTLAFWNLDREEGQRQAREAVGLFEEAIARNPWDMNSHFGLAKAYAVIGDAEASLAVLRRTVEFAPNERAYRREFLAALREQGRETEAAAWLQRRVESGRSARAQPLRKEDWMGRVSGGSPAGS